MSDPLRKVSPGDRLSIPASTFNAFVDAARYVRNRQTDQYGRTSALDFALQQMVVKSVQPDHLICRRLKPNGEEGSLDVYVLKPWTLRRTPFDGLTIGEKTYTYHSNTARTVTRGDSEDEDAESEYQRITPDYATIDNGDGIDCVIFAAMTDVLGQLDPEDVYSDEHTLLVDVNVDGRAWAVSEEEEEEE